MYPFSVILVLNTEFETSVYIKQVISLCDLAYMFESAVGLLKTEDIYVHFLQEKKTAAKNIHNWRK